MDPGINQQLVASEHRQDMVLAVETPAPGPSAASAGPPGAEGTSDQSGAAADLTDQPSLPRRSRFRGLTW
jgi:hypothetical protein